MKRILTSVVLFALLGCSDGDLQVEALDFDSSPVSFCGSNVTEDTQLLFKISGREAIILELDEGMIQQKADTTLVSQFPSGSRLVYRLFSEDVEKAYFCDNIPPAKPLVVEEAEATEGSVTILTSMNATDENKLDHEILISDLTLENAKGERLTDLRISAFGTVTTQLP